MQAAAEKLSAEEEWKNDVLAAPEALGVEQITSSGLTLRVTVRTTSAAQWRVARELRARVTEALGIAGVPGASGAAAKVTAHTSDTGASGAT
jgi:small conductance mechanosensitive channel